MTVDAKREISKLSDPTRAGSPLGRHNQETCALRTLENPLDS